MNILQQPPPTALGYEQRFVLHNVSWHGYELILEGLGSRNQLRVTYDRGTLELMSPLPIHEVYKIFFSHLFTVLYEELDLPGQPFGSTTFRREDVARGVEPDECFYFASAARLHDWRVIDLRIDPPPDLAIEIEISRTVTDRIGIYAALGVPEIWACSEERLRVLSLRPDATYEERPDSVLLPFMPLDELLPYADQHMAVGVTAAFLRALRAWVRSRILPRFQAWKAAQPGG